MQGYRCSCFALKVALMWLSAGSEDEQAHRRHVDHFRIHEIRVVSSDPVPAMKGSAPGGIRP
jgi:hypothetical protein